jgi:hypothetical protein
MSERCRWAVGGVHRLAASMELYVTMGTQLEQKRGLDTGT